MMPYYKATQKQRDMERQVRQTRNGLVGLDEGMKVNPALQNEFAATSIKPKDQEARLKDFCGQTGLTYETPRVQVQGFNISVSQRTVWANKKACIVAMITLT